MKSILLIAVAALLVTSICHAGEDWQELLGHWEGTITIMQDEIQCLVDIAEEDGELQAYMSIPIQMMRDHPLQDVRIDYPDIYFNLSAGGVTANFEGKLVDNQISGNFRQQGTRGIFKLVRGEKREASPKPTPIEGETQVNVKTHFGNIYGSLLKPETSTNLPLVIIIAGSGPTDRNGNNPMMGEGYIYRDLALELREHGIASLRFDKRGVGASSEAMVKEEDLRFDYFVQDVVHWIEKMQDEEEFSPLILLGHSEGSLIGIAAAQQRKVDGLISVAGMGRPIDELLIEQMSRQPEPYDEEGKKIVESLREGVLVQDVDEDLSAIFRPEIQPYLLSMMRYNPVKEIAEIDMPLLIIQGTTDLQVTEKDAQLLHQANNKSELVIIDGMNHVMRDSSEDLQQNFRTYGTPGLPFSEGFIENIVDYINSL